MTHLSPYGPLPTRGRLVLPVEPARGWALADSPRRIAAVLALPLAALLVLLAQQGRLGTDSQGLLVWLAIGPATFYSLARVLRPEERHPERTSRHLAASAATAFGVPTIAVLVLGETGDADDLVIALGSIAFFLGVLTVVWGLFAMLIRALQNAPAAEAPATASRRS